MQALGAAVELRISEEERERRRDALDEFLDALLHDWARTLAILGLTLVPIFFVLDNFMMPRELLPKFAWYRGICTALVIGQYFFLRITHPSRWSYLHGYFFSIVVGGTIAGMTTELGGFNSTYYAGMNLVLIAVDMLMPWAALHSAINGIIVIGIYVLLNVTRAQTGTFDSAILINNLYFLCGTVVIATSINYVKQKLIVQEFYLRSDLKAARDALWGEMEVAKRIQTSLLPKMHKVMGYEIAATMLPADEVGGDYYDVIESPLGEAWVCVGDVSGHGVESGLIMMMTQTSIFATLSHAAGQRPSQVLANCNSVLKTNISRLAADRYVTCMAMQLRPDSVVFAGKHQDVLIYRARTGLVEPVSTDGVWLGLVDDISSLLQDDSRPIEENDVILLYTDGITEAMNDKRDLFGDERLRQAFARSARLGVDEIVKNIVQEVWAFMHKQKDDVTLVAVRRLPAPRA